MDDEGPDDQSTDPAEAIGLGLGYFCGWLLSATRCIAIFIARAIGAYIVVLIHLGFIFLFVVFAAAYLAVLSLIGYWILDRFFGP